MSAAEKWDDRWRSFVERLAEDPSLDPDAVARDDALRAALRAELATYAGGLAQVTAAAPTDAEADAELDALLARAGYERA